MNCASIRSALTLWQPVTYTLDLENPDDPTDATFSARDGGRYLDSSSAIRAEVKDEIQRQA